MVKVDKDHWIFGKEGITRRLSWREAAAIQTFPRNMEFFGDLTSIYKQIGNAVPVVLAEYVANYIRPYLE
jgi:DNA (cytosine-5)-methyltransferase 1